MSARAPARLLVGATLVAAVATVARADAPPNQYGFFNSSSLAISDNHTGLTWERYAEPCGGMPTNCSPATVGSQIKAAAQCSSLTLGGLSWRLPSYKELETLVDEYPHVEYQQAQPTTLYIDENAFFGTPGDRPFWSSSTSASSAAPIVVDFGTGQAASSTPTPASYVRCVSGW